MSKNCVYQYWDGPVRESCRAGVDAMREYANRIGAEYIFDDNPHFLKSHFGCIVGDIGWFKIVGGTNRTPKILVFFLFFFFFLF